jgi:hypothetical protein
MFKSYYGDDTDPQYIDPIEHSKPITTSADPKFFKLDPREPIGTYPDRIVTCQLIQDLRPIVHVPDYNTITVSDKNNKYERVTSNWVTIQTEPIQQQHQPIRLLYLQRRLLLEQYYIDRNKVQCIYCGQWFTSMNGFRYHISKEICIVKSVTLKKSISLYFDELQKRVDKYFTIKTDDTHIRDIHGRLKFGVVQGIIVKLLKSYDDDNEHNTITTFPFALSDEKTMKSDEIIKQKNPVVYVYEHEKGDGTHELLKVEKQGRTKIDELHDDILQHPGDVYQQALDEYYTYQGQMLGSIYPAVFTHLKFMKPRKPKRKLSRVRKNIQLRKRRKSLKVDDSGNSDDDNSSNDERPPIIDRVTPLPPIVDIRVCIGECDAGRYPSVQRNINREHYETCAVCCELYPPKSIISFVGPTTQTLYPCIFCSNVVHYCCMLTKFTVKEPEADDEFMCYRCIRVIQARRNRAEKRRIGRLVSSSKPFVNEQHCLDSSIKEVAIQLTKGIVVGKEYESVTAQGKLLNDVTELIRDTHMRLTQQLNLAAVNCYRKYVIEEIEQCATL